MVEVPEQDGVLSPGLEILQNVGQRRSHDPATIRCYAVLRTELQACLLE